jgi:hypothetical protein
LAVRPSHSIRSAHALASPCAGLGPELPEGIINLSDPDSGDVCPGTRPRQAYNAQAAVNDREITLAAEVTVDAPDFGHLERCLTPLSARSSAAAWSSDLAW